MKIKSYLIFVLLCIFLIIGIIILGIVFSLINGIKYSSFVVLLGSIIQGLCAIIVLFYAIYHDDWKDEKKEWPKPVIESNCYMGVNDPNGKSILIHGKDDTNTAIFDCKITIKNNCRISNLHIKNKKHGKIGYIIDNLYKFNLTLINDKKQHFFFLQFEDDYGNMYLQKILYFIRNYNNDITIKFIHKQIKPCILLIHRKEGKNV
jgi:hypothetical protein